jgi:AraC-like DNA-binding protein
LYLIRRFQRRLRDQYSKVGERDLHRSVWFLWGYIGVTLGMMAILVLAMFLRIDVILANGVFGLLLGACVYALAYVSWPHARGTEAPMAATLPTTALPTTMPSVATDTVRPDTASDRPRRSVHYLSDQQFASLTERMVQGLEVEKAYLDGDLTLAQLSGRMDAPAHQVSEVISRYYRCNFFDAVNRLRVDEVKRRLVDPQFASYSILGISMDAGFNSKSSFNTAFRKHTGTTPSEFRRS